MTTYEIGHMLETMQADYALRQKFEKILERTHDHDLVMHRLHETESHIQTLQLRVVNLELLTIDGDRPSKPENL